MSIPHRRARTAVGVASVGALVTAALVTLPDAESLAQTCSRNCPAARRDPHGCCPEPAARPSPRPAEPARAGAVAPAFDIGGHWRIQQDSISTYVFQDGAHVTLVWVAAGWRAVQAGDYVTPTVVRMTGRRHTPDGCVHRLDYTIAVTNARALAIHSSSPEGGCDTRVGQQWDLVAERVE